METPPPASTPPLRVYVVEFTDESEEFGTGQAGAFTTEAEAMRLCDLLRDEGRGPVRVDIVSIHETVEDWRSDQ